LVHIDGGHHDRTEPWAAGHDAPPALLQLPSWAAFGAEDPLHERAVEQMLVGVSTRRYGRSLEPLPADLPSRGTSRSAVSRRFVAATERQMSEWLGRDLSALELGVLMIDGIHIEEHVMLIALGVDADGRKHVLGVREGATENAAACTALLADLRDRVADVNYIHPTTTITSPHRSPFSDCGSWSWFA